MEQSPWQHGRRFCIDTTWQSAADAIFMELILARAVRALRSDRWSVAPDSLLGSGHPPGSGSLPSAGATPLNTLPGTILFRHSRSSHRDDWLLDFPPSAFALIEHAGESLRVRVAADCDSEARRILYRIRAAVPETTVSSRSVRVTLWTLGEHGAQSVTKDLEAPPWGDIERNYPPATSGGLSRLLVSTWRPHAGRLLLWHGDPGTGKTHAVRALMRAWKSWCSFHVILDPEKFFGSSADYMMNVLLGHGGFVEGESGLDANQSSWRLLILEDTGELLSIDARDRAGQGLSRLLNLCDGLLGQSLNVLVLITTNEDFGRMHPAVVRPGRCLANVEFRCFDSADARRWLVEQGMAVTDRNLGATTLAGLYSQLDGRSAPARDPIVGFLSA